MRSDEQLLAESNALDEAYASANAFDEAQAAAYHEAHPDEDPEDFQHGDAELRRAALDYKGRP